MELKIDIVGEGKVETVVENNAATLTAKPADNWTFKHYQHGQTFIKEESYQVSATDTIPITVVFYVTIEDYLKGLVGFELTEIALNSIRVYRGIAKYADVGELSAKEKELIYADTLMWAATSPTSYTGSKDSDGGWSHTEASKTISVTDKKRFENMAMAIYKKYLDKKYNSGIKIVNLW